MFRTPVLALATGAALVGAGWALWRGEAATAIMLIVLASALGGAAFGSGLGRADAPEPRGEAAAERLDPGMTARPAPRPDG